MHIYYLETINLKEYELVGSVYLLQDKLDHNQSYYDDMSIFAYEPADIMQQERDEIIGIGSLIKNWIRGRLYMSPCNIEISEDYRGKGLGKVLYKSILKGIEHHIRNLKTKPMLAQHSVVENVPLTTSDANNIYKSLEREGLIFFLKDVLYGEGYSYEDCYGFHNDDFEDNEYRGGIYKINRYPPDLRLEYINTVSVEQLGDDDISPIGFRLWEVLLEDGGT